MNIKQVQTKLSIPNMPFDITPDVAARVKTMMDDQLRRTGEAFGLKARYVEWLRRWNKGRLLNRRLCAAADLRSREANLWMAVITTAVDDLTRGWHEVRAAGPGERTLRDDCQSAIEYFDSSDFDDHCEIVGINPEWAYRLIDEYWQSLRR